MRAAIEAAKRQEGVSLQEYILSAAYDRATAVEKHCDTATRTASPCWCELSAACCRVAAR
ncbi:hypothetical protein DI272_38215 [Streptomyces sp. Act143]|nr:hypothetical protein DI272_38215 [Streptomyces sp. Act143]